MGIEKIVSIKGTVILSAAAIGALSLYLGIVKPMNERAEAIQELEMTFKVHKEFNQVYNNALMKYADRDKDGFVSAAEKDAFDKDLMKDKEVTLVVGDIPRYKNGDEVPIETVMKWIRNYRSSE